MFVHTQVNRMRAVCKGFLAVEVSTSSHDGWKKMHGKRANTECGRITLAFILLSLCFETASEENLIMLLSRGVIERDYVSHVCVYPKPWG
jgi:hypothetical protein